MKTCDYGRYERQTRQLALPSKDEPLNAIVNRRKTTQTFYLAN